MIHVRQPIAGELEEHQRMRCQEVGRVSQRAQMVLLSWERHSVPEVAHLFQTCRASIRFWIKRSNRQGPLGLYDGPPSGRPRKAGERGQNTFRQLFQSDPHQKGYLATYWTVSMLLVVIT